MLFNITRDLAGANRSRRASGVWSAANSNAPLCVIASTCSSWTHAFVGVFMRFPGLWLGLRVRATQDMKVSLWFTSHSWFTLR